MFYNALVTSVYNEIYCCVYMRTLQDVYLYKITRQNVWDSI